jgi:Xaa-Pro aminopeptidase
MFFTRNEYVARWERVQAAMAAAGHETVIVWQRSAGTYDRVGDVYWLTHFYTNGTGQDPPSEEYGAPWTFNAVLLRKGREPELHVGLPIENYDVLRLCFGRIVVHEQNMMKGLAEHFRKEGIEGRIAIVGDDVLPGLYDRTLRRHTPQIEWVADEHLLVGPQMIKSARELEAFRIGGELVTAGLTAAVESLIDGKRACEAAARAAAAIIGGGGCFHRIDIHHGPATQKFFLSRDLYGYDMKAPSPGDLFTVWIYGPIFAGYWQDPGRTGICGNRPTPEQRSLLEDCAKIVDGLVAAIKPGTTARAVGAKGAEIARQVGYFESPPGTIPLFGHGLGTSFPPFIIPVGDVEGAGMDYKSLDESIKPGMVLAAEAFLARPGLGTAGYENNFIVSETGVELLDRTPMIFW